MSSTFPHFATSGLATSFSASYAQQSNLETLMERHLSTHPEAHAHTNRRRSSAGQSHLGHEERAILRRQPSTVNEEAVSDDPEADEETALLQNGNSKSATHRHSDSGASANANNQGTPIITLGSGHQRQKSSGGGSRASNSHHGPRLSMSMSMTDASKRNLLTSIVGGHQASEEEARLALADSAGSPLLSPGQSPFLPTFSRDNSADDAHSHHSSHSRPRSSSRSRQHRNLAFTSGFTPGFTSSDVSAAAATHGGAHFPKTEEEVLGHGGTGWQDSLPMKLDPADELDPVVDLGLPGDEDGEVVLNDWKASSKSELFILFRTATPILFTQIAEYSLVLSSVISLGHLGTTELAASSLASMTASVTAFSILQGMASALDTLLPAAWTSNDPTRVGLWTQRMVVVMSVFLIPMYFIWWNAEAILLVLRQEPRVAAMAQEYLSWLSIGIPGYAMNQIMRKYFQSQNLMTAPTIVIAIVAPLNAILNYLLVWGPDKIRLGFIGAPLATAISYNSAAVVAMVYAAFVAPRTAWGGFSRDAFSKLGTVTSLGLAGTIMISSEWWAWEFVSIAASQLGPVVLAVNSILLSFSSIFFQVPNSLGIAVAVRVGNLLGAARPYEAKIASRVALGVASFTSIGSSAILMIFRHKLVYLFNSDPLVVDMVPKVAVYVAAFQLADGLVGTMGGSLRAIGKQSAGALFNLTAYYVIGLPLGVYLCFSHHLGLAGLWIGLSIALYYCAAAMLYLLLGTDWDRAVAKTRERLGLGPATGKGDDEGIVNYGTMGGH